MRLLGGFPRETESHVDRLDDAAFPEELAVSTALSRPPLAKTATFHARHRDRRHTRRAGLVDDDLGQLGKGRRQLIPDPAGEELARRVLEAVDVVQVVVVEAIEDRSHRGRDVGEVADPPGLLPDRRFDLDPHLERVSVETRALVTRQARSGAGARPRT